MDERKRQVLQAIIDDYISTANRSVHGPSPANAAWE